MKDKELWLLNTTNSDVSLSDLGVKVLANKTANVYASNPYLTEEQVKRSMTIGSLQKRIISGALKVVKTDTKKRPAALDKVQESKQPVMARKTKSSIVVEHTETESVEGKGFEFADYGLGELESEVEKEKTLVTVKAKQDELPVEATDTETIPKTGNNLSTQSAVVMDIQKKNMNNPVGKLAEPTTNKQPYIVTKAPVGVPEVKEEFKAELPKITKAGDTILVGQEQARNIKEVAKVQRSEEGEVKIEMAAPDIDAKVATKTEKGAIVMELREVPKKETKPKKVKKSKPTS